VLLRYGGERRVGAKLDLLCGGFLGRRRLNCSRQHLDFPSPAFLDVDGRPEQRTLERFDVEIDIDIAVRNCHVGIDQRSALDRGVDALLAILEILLKVALRSVFTSPTGFT
jgi:hypothetical protein